jgi:dihydroorotase
MTPVQSKSQIGESLTLTMPDDWHAHLRDGTLLQAILPHTVRRFARAIAMPNLKPPVVSVETARTYRQRILNALPEGCEFTPLMTLYLTEATSPLEIAHARDSGAVFAVKYYPAGVTTHAEAGVTALRRVYPVLAAMERAGLPLLVHGEVNDPAADIFDRERIFIESELIPLLRDFPGLQVVLEHITTREAVDFVTHAPKNIAATLTVHHLLLNRNALFIGGLRPHHYCLPVLKREEHRLALVAAATSGNPKFFLGTDSAPHLRRDKESACGCAGVYTAHAALELYAELFEQVGALDKLEAFASFHGADFYGLPRNSTHLTLVKSPWQVPAAYDLSEGQLVPFRSGERVLWKLTDAC